MRPRSWPHSMFVTCYSTVIKGWPNSGEGSENTNEAQANFFLRFKDRIWRGAIVKTVGRMLWTVDELAKGS